MMRRSALRQRKGAKRLDLSDFAAQLGGARQDADGGGPVAALAWIKVGLVWKPDDAEAHFFIEEKNGVPYDVFIEVQTSPEGDDLTCRLGVAGGGTGAGYWDIPPIDTEVVVALPAGRVDFMPFIIALHGTPPARISGERAILVAAKPLEIIAPSVTITDSEGGQALATKADLDALASAFGAHTHPVPGVSTGIGATTSSVPSGSTPSAAGTSVLRAK